MFSVSWLSFETILFVFGRLVAAHTEVGNFQKLLGLIPGFFQTEKRVK